MIIDLESSPNSIALNIKLFFISLVDYLVWFYIYSIYML